MKVSELIAELQKAMAEHGDVIVYVFGCDSDEAEAAAEVYMSADKYMMVTPW